MRLCAVYLTVCVLIVSGCGGGSAKQPIYRSAVINSPPLTAPTRTFHVGHPTKHISGRSKYVDHIGGVGISAVKSYDGPGAGDVVQYLRQAIPSRTYPRFNSRPRVLLARGTNEKQVRDSVLAIRLVNTLLPEEYKLILEPSYWSGATNIGSVPNGKVVVVFKNEISGGHRGLATMWYRNGRRKALVQIRSDSPVTTISHELLHAIGLHGHVSKRNKSIINAPSRGFGEIDYPAIHAAFSRYDGTVKGKDISVDNLGEWSTERNHLVGNIAAPWGFVKFGVTRQNDLILPWARGTEPDMPLSRSTRLSGNVKWTGAMVGMSSSGAALAGDAALNINLGNLRGTLDMDIHETRQSLRYDVKVDGNRFSNTGGDYGVVNGGFFGPSHEGMAGTLERHDIKAAFGGKR